MPGTGIRSTSVPSMYMRRTSEPRPSSQAVQKVLTSHRMVPLRTEGVM